MRYRFAAVYAAACLALSAGLGACDDPFGGRDAIVISDTVFLAAPGSAHDTVASAVDLVLGGAPRFPERIADADAWDLAVRAVDGQLVFRPYPVRGNLRGAMITGPLTRDFDDARTAPRSRSEYGEEPVVLEEGKLYFARSRQYVEPPGILCVRYAKFVPLEVNPAEGTVRLEYAVNGYCDDERLDVD